MAIIFNFNNEIKWPLLQGTPNDYCTPYYIVRLPTIHSASPISIYPHCEVYVPPIMRCASYCKVYLLLLGIPLLRGIPPIAMYMYTPYCEVYSLLQGIPPSTRYTPYCEVYPLVQGIPLLARYTPYCEVYPLLQGIPPIVRYTLLRGVPYYKVYPLL